MNDKSFASPDESGWLICPLSLCLHGQSPSISKPRHTAAPTRASKVDSRWGGMGQKRRYKRKGRRILTRFLGFWGESRHRRTPHRLRNQCDSRSSRTHRSICPIPPHRRLHYLNSYLRAGNSAVVQIIYPIVTVHQSFVHVMRYRENRKVFLPEKVFFYLMGGLAVYGRSAFVHNQ